MWWLYIFYGIAWLGYIYLSHLSRTDDSFTSESSQTIAEHVIWRETPVSLRYAELGVGIASWIILGVYISLSSGYDSVTLLLFFIAQYAYIGTMLWERKQLEKKKKAGTEVSVALYASLTFSVLFLLVHLFLGGTYGWMILIVSDIDHDLL